MNDVQTSPTDPRILGLRLQEARRARGMTQQEAAEELRMSRPTYIAIEKGERAVQPHELIRLAELYARPVHELLRQRKPVRDFVAHFRTAASRVSSGGPELDEAVALLQRLSDDYLELEEKGGSSLPRNYPAAYQIFGRDPAEAAEEIAAAERNRLGLGDGPVSNLRDLLETDVGLRIFYLALPSRVAGLFVFTEELGGCIAIQRKHPPGRRLWSLAHEYAHFLVHRYEAEVTVLRSDSRASARERFADAFARSFLLPGLGLRRRFHDLQRSAGQITPAALITLADLYGVSVEAMLVRLEDLRLIPVGTWLSLKDRGFHVKEAHMPPGPGGTAAERWSWPRCGPPARAAGGGLGSAPSEPWLPRRYQSLAAQAYEDELLSEGQLVEILHTDREQARRIVHDLMTRREVSQEGEAGDLYLNVAKALGGPRSGS